MHFENLQLQNFKNFEEIAFDFCEGINCFVGANGVGKTNLLDALHYLSQTRSAFNTVDNQNIRHGEPYFVIRAGMVVDGKGHRLHLSLKRGEKKVLRFDKQEYEKLRDHIGKVPLVMITPYDTDLIREGSEMRRKFFDGLISQFDTIYMQDLVRYTQLLKQRNALLKQLGERGARPDRSRFEPYDRELLSIGRKLHERRLEMMERYTPLFTNHYQELASGKEHTMLRYHSDLLEDDFDDLFLEALPKDIALQRTTMGIHKDDYVAVIDGQALKKFGSQGQQKSFVIAMKLAQFDMLKEQKGLSPVLLLDDIFDKLDDQRIGRLMELVAGNTFGQLFVTDARPERTLQLFGNLQAPMRVFEIREGEAKELLS